MEIKLVFLLLHSYTKSHFLPGPSVLFQYQPFLLLKIKDSESSHPSEKEVNIRIKYDSPSLPFLLSGKGLFVPFVLQPYIHYDSSFSPRNL